MLLIDVILLSAAFARYPPSSDTTALPHLDISFTVCNYHLTSPPLILIAIYKIGIILFGAVIAYLTSRLFKHDSTQQDFNESNLIGYCLYNVLFFMVLVLPIVAALNEDQWKLRNALYCVAMIVTSQFNAILLFIPKVVRIYKTVFNDDSASSRTQKLNIFAFGSGGGALVAQPMAASGTRKATMNSASQNRNNNLNSSTHNNSNNASSTPSIPKTFGTVVNPIHFAAAQV
eukprot:c13644_g1_i1.p1 GENE.c13644_g1_i1~~c13644_g1_i1.p1  ORF type:complete len:231 (-),score=48.47 c13644_g1_i1:38-730(-)